jgi:hypothetical protein
MLELGDKAQLLCSCPPLGPNRLDEKPQFGAVSGTVYIAAVTCRTAAASAPANISRRNAPGRLAQGWRVPKARRQRKPDPNYRSRKRRTHQIDPMATLAFVSVRGTEGSNPSPSTGESAANLIRGGVESAFSKTAKEAPQGRPPTACRPSISRRVRRLGVLRQRVDRRRCQSSILNGRACGTAASNQPSRCDEQRLPVSKPEAPQIVPLRPAKLAGPERFGRYNVTEGFAPESRVPAPAQIPGRVSSDGQFGHQDLAFGLRADKQRNNDAGRRRHCAYQHRNDQPDLEVLGEEG